MTYRSVKQKLIEQRSAEIRQEGLASLAAVKQRIEQDMVTLASGEAVESDSAEWKAECFKRWECVQKLLGIVGVGPRRDELDAIEKAHGAVFRQRVEEAFADAFRARRAAEAPNG